MDKVIYRCIKQECARPLPRALAFCPYCGANQRVKPAAPTRVAEAPPQPSPQPAATPPVPPAASPTPPPAAAPTPPPAASPAPPPAKPAAPAAPAAQVPPPAPPLIPAAKKKSLTRYWPWLIVALFVIWLFDTAPADKHASRVAAAVALSAKCEIAQARSELAKLKTGKATPEQIKRASQAIERSAPACEKAQQREKAWSETKTAVDSSLQAGTHAKAVSALAAFTRRWGTDAKTQELKNMIELKQTGALVDMAEVCLGQGDRVCAEQRLSGAERRKQPELSGRIDQLREQLRRLIETPTGAKPALPATVTLEPKAAPTAQPVQPPIAPTASNQATALPSQSARNMVNNAERDLAHGNYKGAADKMEICMTIIDPGNQDCQQLKQKADRLNRKMMECVASGAEWINERCQ